MYFTGNHGGHGRSGNSGRHGLLAILGAKGVAIAVELGESGMTAAVAIMVEPGD